MVTLPRRSPSRTSARLMLTENCSGVRCTFASRGGRRRPAMSIGPVLIGADHTAPGGRNEAGSRRIPHTRKPQSVPRYKLTLEYDGTGLVGWQRQANGLSVQEVLETACARMAGGAVYVQGAGRTDAGVHATGQAAHIDLPAPY